MVLTLAAHILKVEQYRKDPLHRDDTHIHEAFHISVTKIRHCTENTDSSEI